MRYQYIVYLFFFCIFSCNKTHEPVARSFYYWQSNFSLNEKERNALDSLSIQKLYIKFFDVTWDAGAHQPLPVANITFSEMPAVNIELIPVVFITNEVFNNIDEEEAKTLAYKISKRIENILEENSLHVPNEIQLDCDWTESSGIKYFLLIEEMQKFPAWKNTEWSSTIRLHQIKYFERTGIPPVDRGMLMFYNMGNIEDPSVTNSIFDADIAKQYIEKLTKYPLPLDAAIACFSWGLLFENDQLLKIFYPLNENNFPDSVFKKESDQIFVAKKNFYFEGQYLVQGNKIKLEVMSPQLSIKAAELLSHHLANYQRSVILYHLDSNIVNQYTNENLHNIFSSFE